MLENINIRQSIRSLANEARVHRTSEDSANQVLSAPMKVENLISTNLSFEEKRERDLLLKKQIELQGTLNGFFGGSQDQKSGSFFSVEEKRPVGRPRKLNCEKVKRVGMKLPPELLKFLTELKIEGGRGFGSKIRAIIEEWNVLKKREREQLQTLKKNLERLEGAVKSFSGASKGVDFVHRNEEVVSKLKVYCESVVQLANLYCFDDGFLKKRLITDDYKNYQFAVFYLSNSRERVQ